MAELADAWAAEGIENIWGNVPVVQQMQSEGGAAGTVHGSLQSGALTTTFTASQGLLLMLPNMYKIAGELSPCVFHVAARALATQALSIFGDHSDVMSARMTGFAMLAAASVQEAHDLALVAQAATLESRVPIMYFFDGFRTSHEENKISIIPDEQIRAMIDDDLVRAFRARALSPGAPGRARHRAQPGHVLPGARDRQSLLRKLPGIVQKAMDGLAALTGRRHQLFRYSGHPEADRVVVAIGSACEVLDETAAYLNAKDEKLGVLAGDAVSAVGRGRVPGGPAAIGAGRSPISTGRRKSGRRASRCTPTCCRTFAHAAAAREVAGDAEADRRALRTVFEGFRSGHGESGVRRTEETESKAPLHGRHRRRRVAHQPRVRSGFRHRVAGRRARPLLRPGRRRHGRREQELRQDSRGRPGRYAQGYFVYDSKKSGSYDDLASALRTDGRSARPICSSRANFVGVHKFDFLFKQDVLAPRRAGATVLLNSPYGPDEVWDRIAAPTCSSRSSTRN